MSIADDPKQWGTPHTNAARRAAGDDQDTDVEVDMYDYRMLRDTLHRISDIESDQEARQLARYVLRHTQKAPGERK